MDNHVLVGCIQSLSSVIRTRFFYVNRETLVVKDVTLELCDAIENFNKEAKKIRQTGKYSMLIPYEYKNGMAEYGFGCGLSHYLQENTFEPIVSKNQQLSFPLTECRISMYTPSDVKHILNCKGVFATKIRSALKERFGLKKTA